jgi:heme/copper-type cytochrome/quinol oxidase subunit 4
MVQLFFFLHIGRESKPRLNAAAFLFATLVVTILVAGSLWIMDNLNYHHGAHEHKTPAEVDEHIIHDEGYRE